MSKTNACPECGVPVANDARLGLCRRCLLIASSSSTAAYVPAESTGTTPANSPIAGWSDFCAAIREFDLVIAQDLDPLMATAAGDPSLLARHLVRLKKLTAYQAGALLQGKARGLLIGQYLVLDKLGVGGMGVVFKALHRTSQRLVALKMLPPSFGRDREAVRRFRREFEVASRLSHPNLVAAIEAGEDRGVHFLTMDFIDGHDLECLVERGGPLSVERALHCAIQAARGLEAAHALGVVHRDIKPGNIMIDAAGSVRVLDLGLARVLEATSHFGGSAAGSLTQTGAYMGTVDFLAPEQADDAKRADHRADIYSLGCTLYFLLTGRPPFGGDTILKRLMAHQERPAPFLRDARSDASEAIEDIYQKMMAKRPSDRPQSITQVMTELEACRSSTRETGDASVDLQTFARTVMKRAAPRRRRGTDASIFARPEPNPDGFGFNPDLNLEDLVAGYREERGHAPLAIEKLPPIVSRPLPARLRRRRRSIIWPRLIAFVLIGLAIVGAFGLRQWRAPNQSKPSGNIPVQSPASERIGQHEPTEKLPSLKSEPKPAPAKERTQALEPAPVADPRHGPRIYSDDFENPSSGWPAERPGDAAKASHHHWGYANGTYRLDANAPGLYSWGKGLNFHDFYCEVRGHVFGDHPASQGSIMLELISDEPPKRGLQVRLTTQGEVFLEPSFRTNATPRGAPRVGPIRHPAIRTGNKDEYNVIGLRMVAHRVEVFVNGARVIGPVVLEWDRTPYILLGVTAEVPHIRAEFDKIEIWADSIRAHSPGTTPTDASGRKLNLDFETGTLQDWTAEGEAFSGQPIEGDTVHTRNDKMSSEHQGKFWVGTYERGRDAPQGTLTSVPFRVTQRFASFLIAGGSLESIRAEIVRKDNGQVIATHRGRRFEELFPVSIDLSQHVDKEIFIRLIDRHTGSLDWAHINFDDFRFHPAPPDW